jgi:hypothetical protein
MLAKTTYHAMSESAERILAELLKRNKDLNFVKIGNDYMISIIVETGRSYTYLIKYKQGSEDDLAELRGFVATHKPSSANMFIDARTVCVGVSQMILKEQKPQASKFRRY